MRIAVAALLIPLLVACDKKPAERAVDPDTAVTSAVVPGAAVVLPRPDIDGVHGSFLGFEATSAGSEQVARGRGTLRPPHPDACSDYAIEYGEPGQTLCAAGLLALPTATAERLPTLARGTAELWAQDPTSLEPALGHAMLLIDLESDELLTPSVGRGIGQPTTDVDVVRRIEVSASGVRVWAKDPDNDSAPPVSGWLDRPAHQLGVLVLPPDASAMAPGTETVYDYTVSMRCRSTEHCEFSRA